MALAMVTGPVALAGVAWQAVTGTPTQDAAASPFDDLDREARRAAATETATQWVLTWLSADKDAAESVSAYWSGQVELPEKGTEVLGADPVKVEATAPGVWTVVVGADIVSEQDSGQALIRRYFQVPVSVAGGKADASARVLSLPAAVSGPGRDAPNTAATYAQRIDLAEPAGVAVRDFLTAYLTGTGDLTRFTAPGTTWRALEIPYAGIEVVDVLAISDSSINLAAPRDGEQVRVLSNVRLHESSPAAAIAQADDPSLSRAGVQSQFALTLTARTGRWEVKAIDASPTTTSTTTEKENS